MSTTIKSLLLALFILSNACGVASSAGSSRSFASGGMGGGAGVEGRALDAPVTAELRSYEPAVAPRDTPEVREAPSFRIESDCWSCR